MSAKYKFVDDTKQKIDSILEILQVYESKEFIADELKNLVSAHALKDLIDQLPEDQRSDYLQKVQSLDREMHLVKFRELFKESELQNVYFTTFDKVINEF